MRARPVQAEAFSACRTKHGYADSDVLSTAGITDPVERVHCKVLQRQIQLLSLAFLATQQLFVGRPVPSLRLTQADFKISRMHVLAA